jgi:hypothetical protein
MIKKNPSARISLGSRKKPKLIPAPFDLLFLSLSDFRTVLVLKVFCAMRAEGQNY